MNEYFSDRVMAAVNAGGPATTTDHAIVIVFTVARLHASLMYRGGTLQSMDVAKSAVRLTMSADYQHIDGSLRIEKARYMLLEYWLRKFEQREVSHGSMAGVHVRPDAG